MAAQNRYLRGKQGTVLADVHGNTTIEAGDLLFIFNTDGDRGVGVDPDNYVYPFTDIATPTGNTNIQEVIASSFVGVAMESSPSGVTEKITIATTGIFRYPQLRKSAVSVGALVCSPSPSAGAPGASVQTVYTGATGDGSTAYLGYCVKTNTSGTTFIDFEIRTIYNGLAT